MISTIFEHSSIRTLLISACVCILLSSNTVHAETYSAQENAMLLDWVNDANTFCGGYYNDTFAPTPITGTDKELVHITGDETLFSQKDTTTLSGHVLFQRQNESVSADQAILYREANASHRLKSVELLGTVRAQEPNTMLVAKKVTYDFHTKAQFLFNVVYRMVMTGKERPLPVGKHYVLAQRETNIPGGVFTAFGNATQVSQTEPGKTDLTDATYTTCPPVDPFWIVKARDINLDRNTGRGSASHLFLKVKQVPIFYLPYISFPIDARRKTGFLWPTFGTQDGAPYLSAPFYWNMAPNYDMFITPTLFSNRGLMLADQFRYLHETGRGNINVTVLPDDRQFNTFKNDNKTPGPNDSATIQASKIRLANASTTRSAFTWHDDTRYNANWASHINFNQVSDDYFLRDFGNTIDDVSQNHLLQEGELSYQAQHWHFIGRLQAYQTLHPFNETVNLNQYRRFPQLILIGNYPDQWQGLEYFIGSEMTNFDMRKTPGSDVSQPIGQRMHLQPGLSLPLARAFGYITPRIQVALSEYTLHQTAETDTPTTINRALPIFDIASGAAFERNMTFGSYGFKQTLEPQIYYTYIPYRRQFDIPLFDTTLNTPTYDQLFNYNRFSGLDRIGDTNQVSVGVSTRLIDAYSGLEKVKLGIGEIMYFSERFVTLCENQKVCNDYPGAHTNVQRFSPITATLDYHIVSTWNVVGNAVWDPVSKHVNNSSVSLHYQQDSNRIINLGLNYVGNNGVPNIKIIPETDNTSSISIPINALKVTDFSFAWPMTNHISHVGRVSHDWASNHLQNVAYGVQYDTCCVSVRLVGNRTFLGLDPDRNYQARYSNDFYIQLSLKGLGNVGNGNPQSILNNISGYTNSQFG